MLQEKRINRIINQHRKSVQKHQSGQRLLIDFIKNIIPNNNTNSLQSGLNETDCMNRCKRHTGDAYNGTQFSTLHSNESSGNQTIQYDVCNALCSKFALISSFTLCNNRPSIPIPHNQSVEKVSDTTTPPVPSSTLSPESSKQIIWLRGRHSHSGIMFEDRLERSRFHDNITGTSEGNKKLLKKESTNGTLEDKQQISILMKDKQLRRRMQRSNYSATNSSSEEMDQYEQVCLSSLQAASFERETENKNASFVSRMGG